MGVLGSTFGNLPGMDSAYLTYETAFGWGPYPRACYLLPKEIDSAAVDTGTPTWRLYPGLVLGQITSSGNLTNYSAKATDGSQIAVGVLMEAYRMEDVFSGSNVAKQAAVMVAGPVVASKLRGLDQKARYDLRAAGFVFDDDPRGPVEWRVVEGAFGNVTTTIPTPAIGATYQNATHFVVTSGAGTATFTLPAIAAGLRYKFSQTMDQSLVVQRGGTDTIVADGNAAATTITSSTTSHKIGASLEVEAVYVGSNAYKWFVHDTSAAAGNILTPS